MWWSIRRAKGFALVVCLFAVTTLSGCKFGFMSLSSTGQNGALSNGANLPGPAAFLVMLGPNQAMSGVCSEKMTVMGMDNAGNPSLAFPQGTLVTISGAEANTLFLDPNCTIPAAAQTVPVTAGTNRADFYVKPRASGIKNMEGEIPGMPNASGSVMVQAGPASNLLISFPTTINSNTCVLGSIALLDQNGNATTATFDITSKLNLSVANGTAFYSDGTCDTVITTGTLEAGVSSKQIWIFTKARSITRNIPCHNPQTIKVQLAPCQRPQRKNTITKLK